MHPVTVLSGVEFILGFVVIRWSLMIINYPMMMVVAFLIKLNILNIFDVSGPYLCYQCEEVDVN